MKSALALFDSIPASQHRSEAVEFRNYDLHDTYIPQVYSLEGNDVKPKGPIRVTEIRRRLRMRFVRVDFFQWATNTLGQMTPQKYMSSYAWQGENAIHLLEQPTVLDIDPFGEDTGGVSPQALDSQHKAMLTLQGEKDIHLDLY